MISTQFRHFRVRKRASRGEKERGGGGVVRESGNGRGRGRNGRSLLLAKLRKRILGRRMVCGHSDGRGTEGGRGRAPVTVGAETESRVFTSRAWEGKVEEK